MLGELWADARSRFRAIFFRAAVEHELEAELRFHIERETEKNIRDGMSREEAERRARLAFGGLNRIKDDARDARGVTFVDHLGRDVRYALRGLRARPLFTSVIVATLALGIGVNAAMFGIVDRLLFRAPAYLADPGSVNRIIVSRMGDDSKRHYEKGLGYRNYLDFAEWSRTSSNLAAFAYRTLPVGEGEQTRGLLVGAVSGSYFSFFDAKPVIGRFFSSEEDKIPGGEPVAVLAHGFWQTEYAGRRDILGKVIRIGSDEYRIIGVAPEGFEGISDQRPPAAFVPITTFAAARDKNFYIGYDWTWLDILVRRKPGVTPEQASTDLGNAYVRSWNAQRVDEPSMPASTIAKPQALAAPLQLARGPLAGRETRVVSWIAGVAIAVLLIACANVANLLLARAVKRRREMAVRRAIGGSSGRLIQQLLTETLVLTVLATIAGLLGAQVAAGGMRRLLVQGADEWPVLADGRTVFVAIALTVLTALLAGLLPAIQVGRGDLAASLKVGTREGAYRSSRARTALLLVQTSLSAILLIGAGLFVRSLRELRAERIGYDVDRIAFAEASMRGLKLGQPAIQSLADRLLDRARTTPGVESATFVASIPFYSGEGRGMWVDGKDSVRNLGRFQLQAGTADYFKTTGTRIIRGRGFTPDDRPGAPQVAVISDAMARAVWPNEDAMGKCFRIGGKKTPCITIVGIAENTKAIRITASDEFMYYLPFPQYLDRFGGSFAIAMFIRTRGPAEDAIQSLRRPLQGEMPGPAYITVRPLHEIVDPTMQAWNAGARMFLSFGALALVLASIGLYAVMAFAVAQRTQELGVRIALGARASDLLRLVVGEGVRVTLFGVVLGGLVAYAVGNKLNSLLFGVSGRDPLVYSVVAATLIVTGVLASVVPASRAARVDPNVALRAE